MEKFEPILVTLLKKEVRSEYDELNLYMSKLNLDNHRAKVFDMLTELHYCDCCDKHQIDKPCIPVKWTSCKIPSESIITCVCDCRHTARMICRMCD
jgi:hypothetical protein